MLVLTENYKTFLSSIQKDTDRYPLDPDVNSWSSPFSFQSSFANLTHADLKLRMISPLDTDKRDIITKATKNNKVLRDTSARHSLSMKSSAKLVRSKKVEASLDIKTQIGSLLKDIPQASTVSVETAIGTIKLTAAEASKLDLTSAPYKSIIIDSQKIVLTADESKTDVTADSTGTKIK